MKKNRKQEKKQINIAAQTDKTKSKPLKFEENTFEAKKKRRYKNILGHYLRNETRNKTT